ncbi:hypothetical protein SNE40_013363 [Patella caerulea]|uniref:Uncharacterized protein n=1 Tax=Patella caerulea TaxID=87958 RepID=A0AAN8JJ61_PATCE
MENLVGKVTPVLERFGLHLSMSKSNPTPFIPVPSEPVKPLHSSETADHVIGKMLDVIPKSSKSGRPDVLPSVPADGSSSFSEVNKSPLTNSFAPVANSKTSVGTSQQVTDSERYCATSEPVSPHRTKSFDAPAGNRYNDQTWHYDETYFTYHNPCSWEEKSLNETSTSSPLFMGRVKSPNSEPSTYSVKYTKESLSRSKVIGVQAYSLHQCSDRGFTKIPADARTSFLQLQKGVTWNKDATFDTRMLRCDTRSNHYKLLESQRPFSRYSCTLPNRRYQKSGGCNSSDCSRSSSPNSDTHSSQDSCRMFDRPSGQSFSSQSRPGSKSPSRKLTLNPRDLGGAAAVNNYFYHLQILMNIHNHYRLLELNLSRCNR